MNAPSSGFFGKIPSRGDFVRYGLLSPTVAALDEWCQRVIPGSREKLGEDWSAAWMEAPIWRFRLAADVCGPVPLAGVWLPSTDRAGRLFPLILALFGPGLAAGDAGLDTLERIGLLAIERDVSPEELAKALEVPFGTAAFDAADGQWWTEGGPRVGPATRSFATLPDSATFATMLSDGDRLGDPR